MATKSEREHCWAGRDLYFDCLKAHNDDPKACGRERREFEKSCSTTWVKFFDRKYELQKYKDENAARNFQLPPRMTDTEEENKIAFSRNAVRTSVQCLTNTVISDAGANTKQESLLDRLSSSADEHDGPFRKSNMPPLNRKTNLNNRQTKPASQQSNNESWRRADSADESEKTNISVHLKTLLFKCKIEEDCFVDTDTIQMLMSRGGTITQPSTRVGYLMNNLHLYGLYKVQYSLMCHLVDNVDQLSTSVVLAMAVNITKFLFELDHGEANTETSLIPLYRELAGKLLKVVDEDQKSRGIALDLNAPWYRFTFNILLRAAVGTEHEVVKRKESACRLCEFLVYSKDCNSMWQCYHATIMALIHAGRVADALNWMNDQFKSDTSNVDGISEPSRFDGALRPNKVKQSQLWSRQSLQLTAILDKLLTTTSKKTAASQQQLLIQLFQLMSEHKLVFSEKTADICRQLCVRLTSEGRNTHVDPVVIKPESNNVYNCQSCGQQMLKDKPLTRDDYEKVQQIIEERLLTKDDGYGQSTPGEVIALKKLMHSWKGAPPDLVVDGWNLYLSPSFIAHVPGFVRNGKHMDERFLRSIKNLQSDYGLENILLVARQDMFHRRRPLFDSLKQLGVVTFVPDRQSNDDLVCLYACATVGRPCLMLSRDAFQSESALVYASGGAEEQHLFDQFVSQHRILTNTYSDNVNNNIPAINFPPLFSVQAQMNVDDGTPGTIGWHVPYQVHVPNAERHLKTNRWLCIRMEQKAMTKPKTTRKKKSATK